MAGPFSAFNKRQYKRNGQLVYVVRTPSVMKIIGDAFIAHQASGVRIQAHSRAIISRLSLNYIQVERMTGTYPSIYTSSVMNQITYNNI